MIHLIYNRNDRLIHVSHDHLTIGDRRHLTEQRGCVIENRHDWTTLARARQAAADATVCTHVAYLVADRGGHCRPRYDIMRAPQVGDNVSETFNGDSYPTGVIVEISKNYHKITTSDGSIFTRRKGTADNVIDSARWCKQGGSTFTMRQGHTHKLNPEF